MANFQVEGLSPQAAAIAEYLVLETGGGDQANVHGQATASEIAENLNLDSVDVNDGSHELRELGLAQYMDETMGPGYAYNFYDITPEARAWLYVDEERLGFDPYNDMVSVARCVDAHQRVSPENLERDTGLPPERINLAALILLTDGIANFAQVSGGDSYDFLEVHATHQTRGWVRDNSR
jgi:hypothetical protein